MYFCYVHVHYVISYSFLLLYVCMILRIYIVYIDILYAQNYMLYITYVV